MTLGRSIFPTNARRFFPSCRDILLVRLDPGTADSYLPADLRSEEDPPPTIDTGIVEFSEAEVRPFVAGGSQLETGPRALSRTTARAALVAAQRNLADAVSKIPIPSDSLSFFLDLQPERCRRTVNSFRAADELSLSISYDAPLDPRILRSVLVFHYEGTVSPTGFSEGIANGAPEDLYGAAPDRPLLSSVVPATGENLRWVGLMDEVASNHGEGGSMLEFRGRDLTGLLMDTRLPSKIEKRIEPGATVLEVGLNLLKTNPAFALIRGPFLRAEEGYTLPRLDPSRYSKLLVTARERNKASRAGDDDAVSVRLRPEKGGGAGGESYWDAIVGLCLTHGLVPYIELDALYFSPPRTLFSRNPGILTAPGNRVFPRPGSNRARLEPDERVRRMAFGDNVSELRFSRKMGRIRAPVVEVSAPLPDDPRRLQTVQWPPQKDSTTGGTKQADTVDATGKNPRTPVHKVLINYVTDESQLRDIAQQVYESMGRQEVGISFSTRDPSSWSGHPDFDPNEDPDLLDLRAGDPIRILVLNTDDRRGGLYAATELCMIAAQVSKAAAGGGATGSAIKAAVRSLEEMGIDADKADQLVRVLASANLPDVFRVNGCSVNFDGKTFTVSIDARDYIRVRSDPSVAARDAPGVVEFGEDEVEAFTAGGVVEFSEDEAGAFVSQGVVEFSEEEVEPV